MNLKSESRNVEDSKPCLVQSSEEKRGKKKKRHELLGKLCIDMKKHKSLTSTMKCKGAAGD